MASVKRVINKNGRVVYRIAISMGCNGQGSRQVKRLTYPVNQSLSRRQQEKEALRYALEMEDKIKYGHEPDTDAILFGDFALEWLEEVRGSIAHGTYVGYEQLLKSRILPYFKMYRIAHVRISDIEAFYRMLAEDYAPGTIRRYANVLSCIFKTAKRWNLISDVPCRYARKPRQAQTAREEKELRYFTPRQTLMFLKSLDMTYGKRGKAVPLQYKVFYALSVFCGFRKGETLALHWEDIDLETQEISITKSIGRTEQGFDYKPPKNVSSVRKIPFPAHVAALLEEYREVYEQKKRAMGEKWQGDGSLFIQASGKRMGHTTTYQYFVKHLKRYNLWVEECPEKAAEMGFCALPVIPLHGLRHSCATLLNYLDVNIVDISKYLGHSSCSTTMNIYAHSFEAQKREARSKLNDFIQKNIDEGPVK